MTERARGLHGVRLPRHLDVERIRVDTFGATRPSSQALSWARPYMLRPHRGVSWGWGWSDLKDRPRWYRGGTYAADVVGRDRRVRWAVASDDDDRYVVKSFRITVRHSVLR